MSSKINSKDINLSIKVSDMFKDIEDPKERKRLMGREYYRRYRLLNPEKYRKKAKKFKEDHPTYFKEHYQKNRNKYIQKSKEHDESLSPEKKEERRLRHQYTGKLWRRKQYRENINYKIRQLVDSAIRRSLKDKNGKVIYDGLDYTIDELKAHLEAQFEPWMNWDNLGPCSSTEKTTWQIDHIRPVNTFDIKKVGDEEFKKCWALSNLRPLDSYLNNRRPKDGSDIAP